MMMKALIIDEIVNNAYFGAVVTTGGSFYETHEDLSGQALE